MESMSLPFSGNTPISRHHSALAAQAASKTRGTKTLTYLRLLQEAGARGLSDHEAASMMGVPLSSINSIRNGCGSFVAPADRVAESPYGKKTTCWKRVA